MIMEVNGVSLYVEDHGEGIPVLLIHGWPDSAHLWRHQIRFLTGHGFRVIAPDMRGFGRSGRPLKVADYALANVVGDVAGILDTLGIRAASVPGLGLAAPVQPRRRGPGTLPARPVPARRAHRVAELVPGQPGAPDAGDRARASSGAGPHAWHLVHQ